VVALHFVRYVMAAGDPARIAPHQGQLLLDALIGVVLPMLVGVVTHRLAASWLKSLALLALSVLSAVLTTVVVSDFHWLTFGTTFMVQFASAVVAHYGLLKPVGITGADGVIQKLIPEGVGATTSDVSATHGPGTEAGANSAPG
jgi:hypothetical protein